MADNESITIKELKHLKWVYQNNISQAVADLLLEFEQKTGISPYGINIEIVDVTPMGGKTKYVVGKTQIQYEI